MVALIQNSPKAYALFIDTVFQGLTPSWWDENGYPVTFATEREAQLELAEKLQDQISMFQKGERDFEDAIIIEDQILEVDLREDGSIQLENGLSFGKRVH